MDINIEYKKNDTDNINAVIATSTTVFAPTPDEANHFHNPAQWVEAVKKGGLLITANVGDKVVGYVLCKKTDDTSFHIYSAGVLPEYRGLGIWHSLYSQVYEYAKQGGYQNLTINTFQSKFDNMYRFVSKSGFQEYRTEDVTEPDGTVVKKSFFRLQIR